MTAATGGIEFSKKSPFETQETLLAPLTVRDCLHDHIFQDWMVEVGLMERSADPLAEILMPKKGAAAAKDPIMQQMFVERLVESQGYIIPREDLAEALYSSCTHDDINAMRDTWLRIDEAVKSTNRLCIEEGIGYSAGVSSLKLAPTQIPVIYTLWSHHEEFVRQKDIAALINNSSLRVRKIIEALSRDVLPNTHSRILRSGVGEDSQYKLVSVESQLPSEPEVESFFPQYLSFEFQDWLASDGVNLLIRQDTSNSLLDISVLSGRQKAMGQVLFSHRGYILPLRYLSQVLYGTDTNIDPVQQVAGSLNQGKRLPYDLFSAKKLGISLGIKELKIPKGQLEVLYHLWRSGNYGVTLEDLCMHISGSDHSASTQNLFTILSELRDSLVRSDYEIVTSGFSQRENTRYTLQLTEQGRQHVLEAMDYIRAHPPLPPRLKTEDGEMNAPVILGVYSGGRIWDGSHSDPVVRERLLLGDSPVDIARDTGKSARNIRRGARKTLEAERIGRREGRLPRFSRWKRS